MNIKINDIRNKQLKIIYILNLINSDYSIDINEKIVIINNLKQCLEELKNELNNF